ncbi:LysR substrate-binding domain-containing protein [Pigmentiphaga sp.]|mgnify:FL=1|jgi:Transcriptional regulator|uniref:LysR substrate-binding domain-containing protein n=1 Tax=Pigmentiphaga sp. TaxID=1977564 RepID=UPI0025F9E68F|nr:LysR substrate-binding domain-containing protein [Pigmentiphaga sp.]MBX6318185.1 LysR family transcriptional regulator [Pigmentiphaga sp.]
MSPSPLNRIRLQHIRCLLATAQHGNMRAAAEFLSITQPAVSKIIKELEEIVGKPLVVRQRHGVALTAAGMAFVQHARQGVMALEMALGEARDPEGDSVKLGVLPSLAVELPQEILQSWRARGRHGPVRLETGLNPELLGRLRQGELDVVVGRLAEPDHMLELRFEPLWSEPLVVAMRPLHPLARADWHAWQELSYPVILPLPGTSIYQAADSFLAQLRPAASHERLETLAIPLARNLALNSDALWFASLSTVKQEVEHGILAARRVPGAATEAIGLFTQAQPAVHRPLAGDMAAVVREVAARWRAACERLEGASS